MQKLICTSHTGNDLVKINELLEEGWTVKEMKTAGSCYTACCFILLEKDEKKNGEQHG